MLVCLVAGDLDHATSLKEKRAEATISRMVTPKARSGKVSAPPAIVEAWKAGGSRKKDLIKQFMASAGKDDVKPCLASNLL